MLCPQCNYANALGSVACEKCSTPLPANDETLTDGIVKERLASGGHAAITNRLSPGTLVGQRYQIIRLLGQGGMGAVYEVHDRELDRKVALKVIRADMAESPEAFWRFKQEIILARQITHRNVIRLFDLGQADGIKFITMEYIEGESLRQRLLRKGKLEPREAAQLMAQICRALEAAHAEGVIHRDLKPRNIMLDRDGRAYVMDFGLARSLSASGITHIGGSIGTLDYMSPEQAKDLPLDARSDLFSAGIVFYEMLTGVRPFNAGAPTGEPGRRTSEPPRPPHEVDKKVPLSLSDIVMKCLEIDPQRRFASARELLQQIELWLGTQGESVATITARAKTPLYLKVVGTGLAAALVVMAIALGSRVVRRPAAARPSVSLLIADFENRTGDPVFDGTLEPMLSVALEGAPFISSYNRGQARKVAARLQPNAARMDGSVAELVAVREGLNVVLAGTITKEGNGYKVSVTTLDPTTGKPFLKDELIKAANKQSVLAAAGQLAERIRKRLGDTTPSSVLRAEAETYTAGSLEAAHSYAVAQDLQLAGKWGEAIKVYSHAIELDPQMGRAYAGLAVMYANLGKRQEAEKNYQLAMAQIDRMTDREKYRTRSGYYLLMRNQAKAIEELAELVKQYPADTAGHANLAFAYFLQRDMSRALEEQRHAIAIMPNSVQQRSNLSLYELYAGDFDAAAQDAERILQDNPKFDVGERTLALAKLARGDVAGAKREYAKLQALSAHGASMAATGLADLALYEGRLTDASEVLKKGIAADVEAKDVESASNGELTLAFTQLALGMKSKAEVSARAAVRESKDESVIYRAAQVYLAIGQDGQARQLVAPLAQRLEDEPRLYAKLIEGEAQLRKGNTGQALALFQEAQKLSDSWLGHFDMGRAYLEAGLFADASAEFDTCLSRRGEATAVFLDDVPTYHILPEAYYYEGRASEGLHSSNANEFYNRFLKVKTKNSEDPLVADARKRLAAASGNAK